VKRFILIVLLTSSLLLQLPATWCCMVASKLADSTKPVVTPNSPCCSQRNSRQTKPAGRPCPPSKQCCCTDRVADRLLPSTKRFQRHLVQLGQLVPSYLPPICGVAVQASWGRSFPISPQLHILNCVWLC